MNAFNGREPSKLKSVRSAYLEIAKVWLEAAAAREDGELPIRSHHIDADAT